MGSAPDTGARKEKTEGQKKRQEEKEERRKAREERRQAKAAERAVRQLDGEEEEYEEEEEGEEESDDSSDDDDDDEDEDAELQAKMQKRGYGRNRFGLAFQEVAEETNARVKIDTFDHSVIEVKKEDLPVLLEKLSLKSVVGR
jgi:cell division control protein 45